jgi:hypothetical protein
VLYVPDLTKNNWSVALQGKKKIAGVENVGKYSAGKVKSTLAVSNPYYSMIEFGSVHGSQEPQV